jgi:uncharacterized protein involved in propanediol utilization
MDTIISENTSKSTSRISANIGYACSCGHHGELIQGVFKDNGQDAFVNGLISIPCPIFFSYAIFTPTTNSNIICPKNKRKASNAVKRTLRFFGKEKFGGQLAIYSNIPEKYGLGSSTADVVATIKSVANAFRYNLSPEIIARLAVEIETASDSIMYGNEMMLFAQRKGVILKRFRDNVPAFEVLGCNTDKEGVDTLTMRSIQYTNSEIQEFENLVDLVHRAIETQKPEYIGIAGYRSAQISQKYLPKINFNEFADIVEKKIALGLQVSHSGTVVGFIFDANEETTLKNERVNRTKKILNKCGIKNTWRFTVNNQLI